MCDKETGKQTDKLILKRNAHGRWDINRLLEREIHIDRDRETEI